MLRSTLVASALSATLLLVPTGAQQPIRPIPMTPFADGEYSLLNLELKYQIGDTNIHDRSTGRLRN